MPKQPLSRKRVASEDYESDGGFVEDAPKSKKSKKDAKPSVSLATQKDDDGNEFWEVSEFRGSTMVGIREFYEKDGKMLPGKKGISLSIEQFTAFLQVLPQIDGVLKSKGIDLPKPDFENAKAVKNASEDESGDVVEASAGSADEDGEAEVSSRTQGKASKPRQRRNHEATSDEDED